MECVILFRKSNGLVGTITITDDIAIFANRDEAIQFAEKSGFLQSLSAYQIVELEEL